MPHGRLAPWRRWMAAASVALAMGLLAGALGACSSPEAQPAEPPVTIMRSEGATQTATPTATPGAPVAPAAGDNTEGYPGVVFTPGPTSTAAAYPAK